MKEVNFNHIKNAEEQFNLGLRYLIGIGVSNDLKQAYYWFKQAAKQGNKEAIKFIQNHLKNFGIQTDLQDFCNGDGFLVTNFAQTKIEAEQGNINAQNLLGMCYILGDGVTRDYTKAAYWYRKAAEQGHSVAQNMLASLYRTGKGVPIDEKEAMYWLKKSAEQGNTMAMQLFDIITKGVKIPFK